MGDVIRRDAAARDIFADVTTVLVRSRARGAPWQEPAEAYLAPTTTLIDSIEKRGEAAAKELTARQAALDAVTARIGNVVGKVADDIWNAVGRPRSDAGLSVLFPNGIAYYTAAGQSDQAHRLDLLVSLLESGIHPQLDPAVAKTAADAIRPEVATLRALIDPAIAARAEVQLTKRMTKALATTAQLALANLKRRYRAEGLSEADIHTVIPDRSRSPIPKAEPQPAPALVAATRPTLPAVTTAESG